MRRRGSLYGAIGGALLAAVIAVPLTLGSSHREAPNIMLDPTADNTDVYAFVPRDAPNRVVLVADWIPGQVPANGPNFFRFDDRARYYINIDNNGDGQVDIRYRWQFTTHLRNRGIPLIATPEVNGIRDANVYQTYDLFRERFNTKAKLLSTSRLANNLVVAPANIGPKTIPDYGALTNQAIKEIGGGRTAFAGQRDDPFFIDLGTTFDSLNIRRTTGNEGAGKDDFSGQSTFATILRLPKAQVTADNKDVTKPDDPHAVIGVWASSERKKIEVTNADFDKLTVSRGSWVQVSRLGNPLVNELIIPVERKDEFNRRTPATDLKRFGKFVLKPALAALLNKLFSVNAPEDNRTDIVQALLTGIPGLNKTGDLPVDTLKLNLGVPPNPTPNRFGVIGGDIQGFPNGRRLGDDVVDISLQVVAGFLKGNKVPLGDGVDQNDKPFLDQFPYLAAPTSGFESNPSDRFEPPHAPVPAGGG